LTFLAGGFTIQLAKEYRIEQAGAVDACEDSMATTPSLFPETEQDIFFDIETLRLSHEVEGGWSNIARFGLAVAVTWDAGTASGAGSSRT